MMTDLSPAALFGDLPLLRLRMEYSVDDPELLPDYLGSSWRGVLGWQMQRLCCPFGPRRACSDCLIREQCPYFVLYELQSDLPGFRNAPRPYILLPEAGATADRQYLTITLIGRAVRTVPLLWKTIHEAAEKGLGRERVGFKVHGWLEDCPGQGWKRLPQAESYRHLQGGSRLCDCLSTAPNTPWKLELDPPLRLRVQGRYLTQFDWTFFLSSLAQRLEMLSVIFHKTDPLGREGWTALKERFSSMVPLAEHAIAWKDWSRYSNRQRKKVPMGGLVGNVIISRAPSELWNWLQCASLVHVGKGAVMGLGRIEVSSASYFLQNSGIRKMIRA
jgi:hypothetical protein